MEIVLGHYPQVLMLVLARVMAVVGMVPFYGGTGVPLRIKVAIGMAIVLVLLPVLPVSWVEAAGAIHTVPQLVFAMLREILLGVTVGLICRAAIAACLFGGMIVSRNSSLMMAQSIDPLSGSQNVVMAQVLQTVFILIVVMNDGHLVLLRLLAISLEAVPEPKHIMEQDFLGLVTTWGSFMFRWGLRLGMPVMAVSLIMNACFGLIARLTPDFNILFLSFPIRLLAGIVVFGIVLRFSAGIFGRLTEEMLIGCSAALS